MNMPRFSPKALITLLFILALLPTATAAQDTPESPLDVAAAYGEFLFAERGNRSSLESGRYFPEIAFQLRDQAQFWSTLPANGVAERDGCRLNLSGQEADLTVVELKAEMMAAICEIDVQAVSSQAILFNISGASVRWDAQRFAGDELDAGGVLFNFFEATTVTLGNGIYEGLILAPYASITADETTVNGALIADSLAGTLTTNPVTFSGTLPPLTYDFGDLPAELSFATNLADDGPRHGQDAPLFLGFEVDTEGDGQPDASAWGDGQDESGVMQSGSWRDGPQGGPMIIQMGAGDGCLNAWFDLDESGAFEASEKLIENMVVTAANGGMYETAIDLPAGTIKNPTLIYARFRLTPRDAAYGCTVEIKPDGYVTGGEVEDYFWPSNPEPTAVSFSDISPTKVLESPLLPAMLLVGIMVSILVMVGITIFRTRTKRELR